MNSIIKNLNKEELLNFYGGCNYRWVVIDGELRYIEEDGDLDSN